MPRTPVIALCAGLVLLLVTAAAARAGGHWVRPWQVWLAVGLIVVSLMAIKHSR